MPPRHIYRLELPKLRERSPETQDLGLQTQAAHPSDVRALAELMIAAYWGTIDYDGETQEDAENEVQAYLDGQRGGPPMLEDSRLGFASDQLVCACLVGEWVEKGHPLIAYMITRGEWKGRGIGKRVLDAVLRALAERGYREVWAVITEGNVPSEKLFARFGFQRVGSP